jgi:hypothetical protein
MTDDQFNTLMRGIRLIAYALAIIVGLLAGMLWIMHDFIDKFGAH